MTNQGQLNLHVEEAGESGVVGRREGPGQVDHPTPAEKPKKRIQITSLEAYYKLLPTLPERERAVLEGLKIYHLGLANVWPTAYELFSYMEARCTPTIFDVNSVRPVLTRLKDKGLVEFGERKRCAITGQNAHVWRFITSIQMALWPSPIEIGHGVTYEIVPGIGAHGHEPERG